jgi:hypothetical protein
VVVLIGSVVVDGSAVVVGAVVVDGATVVLGAAVVVVSEVPSAHAATTTSIERIQMRDLMEVER